MVSDWLSITGRIKAKSWKQGNHPALDWACADNDGFVSPMKEAKKGELLWPTCVRIKKHANTANYSVFPGKTNKTISKESKDQRLRELFCRSNENGRWYHYCRRWRRADHNLPLTLKPTAVKNDHWSKLLMETLHLRHVKLWRLLGMVTPCKLWLNPSPNIKLCRLLAASLLAASGWNRHQMSSLAGSLLASSGRNKRRMSSSQSCLAVPLPASSGWSCGQMSSYEDCLAGSLQALVEIPPKCQILQTAWHGHSLQALVEPVSKY